MVRIPSSEIGQRLVVPVLELLIAVLLKCCQKVEQLDDVDDRTARGMDLRH